MNTITLFRKSKNLFQTLGRWGRRNHSKQARWPIKIHFASYGDVIPASVLLETYSSSGKTSYYLFNCGEEVYSRSEKKKMLKSVEHLFITHPSWKNLGGLSSLLRTSDKKLTLFGPRKEIMEIEDARPIFENLSNVISVPDYMYYVNEVIRIDFLLVFSDIHNKYVSFLEMFKKCCVAYLIQVKDEVQNKKEHDFASVLILEIPDHSYLDSLLLSEELKEHCASIGIVVHLSPQSVLDDERFGRFMERFTKDTFHVVLNETCDTSGLKQFAHHDNLVEYFGNIILPPMFSTPGNRKKERPSPGQFYRPNVGDLFLLYKGNIVPHLEEVSRIKYTFDKQKTQQLAKFLEEALTVYRIPEDLEESQYPAVCFLGTGSSTACPYRGQSGIYLQTDENTAMLLDCGEGTWNHLKRCYGIHLDEMLVKIKFIFVSHSHCDHYVGLLSVLKARNNALIQMGKKPDRVVLIAPRKISRIWPLYCNIWPNFEHSILHVTPWTFKRDDKTKQNVLNLLNLKELDLVRVRHISDSNGLVIKHKDGWKIVYSGDTAPHNDLVVHGWGCDILLHEASYPDGFEDKARINNHSTISEAVAVGQKMNAKNIILTHFGAFQGKVPYITDEMLQWSNVVFAYDNMRVTRRTLPFLHLTVPILKCMFEEYLSTRLNRRIRVKK